MENDALFDANAFDFKIRPDQTEHVRAAKEIRARSQKLRDRVAKGSYDNADLNEFWKLASDSPFILRVSNTELSEQAGLGGTFFSTVARDGRKPKLANMLKALEAITATANDRLSDVDRAESSKNSGWVQNPHYSNSALTDKLQQDLLELIRQLKVSNSLSEVQEIDLLTRNSLIALLETTIALLKAPLIEKSIISQAGNSLKALSMKIASDSSAGFFGGLAGVAAAQLLSYFA